MRTFVIVLSSTTSMILGGAVYLLWRPESLRMFSWFSSLGVAQPVASMREWAAPFSHILPSWACLSLPQSLWLLSGCLAIHLIWRDCFSTEEQLWMVAVLLLAIGGELGQAAGVVQGVFDPQDVVLILVAFLAAQAAAHADTMAAEMGRVSK